MWRESGSKRWFRRGNQRHDGPLIHCGPSLANRCRGRRKSRLRSGDHPLARGRKEAAKVSGLANPLRNRDLVRQSSGLAIRSSSGSKLKFQTGWGRNSILEDRASSRRGCNLTVHIVEPNFWRLSVQYCSDGTIFPAPCARFRALAAPNSPVSPKRWSGARAPAVALRSIRWNVRIAGALSRHWRCNMAEKFDPAPHDKHAENPREAAKADRDMHHKLEAGLVGQFSGIRSRKRRAAGAVEAWMATARMHRCGTRCARCSAKPSRALGFLAGLIHG